MIAWLLLASNVNADTNTDPILQVMQTEMSRSFEWLQDQEQPPYWIELAVTDEQITRIEASNGTILEQEDDFERILDLDLRVGDWTLDNTHPIIDVKIFFR